jgi:hypothetical protein
MNVSFVDVLGILLRILRLKVSVYNVFITNQFQNTFAQGGGGGWGEIRWARGRADCEYQGGKLFRLLYQLRSRNRPQYLKLFEKNIQIDYN